MESKLQSFSRRRLHTGIGERTESFLRGMTFATPTAVISRAACGVATIFAARWIGPAEFGSANLALATTFWIQIPLFFGLTTALMHYIPQATADERRGWLADGIRLLCLFGSLTLVAGYFFRAPLARWQGVSQPQMTLGLLWSLGFFIYMVYLTPLSAEERFKTRAASELFYTALFVASIFGLKFLHRLDAGAYVLGLAATFGVTGALGLAMNPFPLKEKSSKARLKKLLLFGAIAALGSVVNALFNSTGKLLANHFLTLPEVGILSAYQGASTQMAIFFLTAAIQVFFPIASRTPDKALLFRKLARSMAGLALPTWGAFGAGIWLYFRILGHGYPLHIGEAALFSLAGTLTLFTGTFLWYLSSTGMAGMIGGTIAGLVGGGTHLALGFWLIPTYRLTGAATAYIAASLVMILGCALSQMKLMAARRQKNARPSMEKPGTHD